MMPDETPELLHSLRDEPIDPNVLAEVRQRVMARVESRGRRIGWWWIPAGFAAAVPIVLLLVGGLERDETLSRSRPVLPPIAAMDPAPPLRLLTRAARSRVTEPHPVRERLSPPAANAEPLVVKLVTDDPDVVIYWLVD